MLWRAVCLTAGTALIDLASMLGFPPYLGWVRVILFMQHWALVVIIVRAATGASTVWDLAGIFTMAVSAVTAIGDKDVPARAKGLAALGGEAIAIELHARPAASEACPLLHAALALVGTTLEQALGNDAQRIERKCDIVHRWTAVLTGLRNFFLG